MATSTARPIGAGPLFFKAFVCDASCVGLPETGTAPSGFDFAVTIKDVAALVSVVTKKNLAPQHLRQHHFETSGHKERNSKKVHMFVHGEKAKQPVGALLQSRFLRLNVAAEVKVLECTLRSEAFLPLLKPDIQDALGAEDSGPDLLCNLLEKSELVKKLLGTRNAPPTQADTRGILNPEKAKKSVEDTGLEQTRTLKRKRSELSKAADAQGVNEKALSMFGKLTTIHLRHKPETTIAEVLTYCSLVNPKVGQAFLHIQHEWGNEHLPKAMRDELLALPKLVVGTAGGAAASGGGAAEEGGGGAAEEEEEDALKKRGWDTPTEGGEESDEGNDSDVERLGASRLPSAAPL